MTKSEMDYEVLARFDWRWLTISEGLSRDIVGYVDANYAGVLDGRQYLVEFMFT